MYHSNMETNTNRKRKRAGNLDESKAKAQKVPTDSVKHDDTASGLSEKSGNDGRSECPAKTERDVLCQTTVVWNEIRAENLDCDYCKLYDRQEADKLLSECERSLAYNDGQLSRVKICGQWRNIPRKQVAHGDSGLSYNFSGTSVPARPWTPLLEGIRDRISAVTGHTFNFVLVNRYKDGTDHIGEHRDDEKDLVSGSPIASLSLGQPRDFVFKHGDARGKRARRHVPPVVVELEHGSLLLMKHPTNTFWYHSLPQRKKLTRVRINMTFRKMIMK